MGYTLILNYTFFTHSTHSAGTGCVEHIPLSSLTESLGVSVSPVEQRELTLLSHRVTGRPADFVKSERVPSSEVSFVRVAPVESLVAIEVVLTNPLQISLDCNNFGVYGRLIKPSEDLTLNEIFEIREDPCVSDQDPNVVEFLVQHVRFEARETKVVRFHVIPKRPGRLVILGLRWDLYGAVNVCSICLIS